MTDEQRARIGRAIRDAREELGLRQRELARVIGVSPWQMCRWERGSRAPSPRFAMRLADVLDLPLRTLLGGEPRE